MKHPVIWLALIAALVSGIAFGAIPQEPDPGTASGESADPAHVPEPACLLVLGLALIGGERWLSRARRHLEAKPAARAKPPARERTGAKFTLSDPEAPWLPWHAAYPHGNDVTRLRAACLPAEPGTGRQPNRARAQSRLGG